MTHRTFPRSAGPIDREDLYADRLTLPDVTAAKIRRMAALEKRSFAEMARILTEEAIVMREFPNILFTDGPTGRRASFRLGLDVWEILEPYVLGGSDWERLVRSYPDFEESMLRTAVRYYEAYPEEIDARIAANRDLRARH